MRAGRRRHLLVPLVGALHSLLPISIATGEPSVRPWRTPPRNVDLVLLEAHARTAAVAEPAAGQLGLDVVDGDGQAGGQALDDHDEGRAVGLAGGQEAQHAANLPAGPVTAEPFGRTSRRSHARG